MPSTCAPICKTNLVFVCHARCGYSEIMSTLFRSSQLRPISVLGRTVPSRPLLWTVRAWTVVVVAGSLLPARAKLSFGTSSLVPAQLTAEQRYRHRILHFLTFGSICFLASLASRNRREALQTGAEVLAVACAVELAQDFFYMQGNVFEWWDVRDDALGIVVAFAVIQLIYQKQPSGDSP